MGRDGVFRRAWDKPPSPFHRWVAVHPYLWAVVVVGAIVVLGAGSIEHYQYSVEWVILAALAAAYALAALVGALLTRRRVRQYDARASE